MAAFLAAAALFAAALPQTAVVLKPVANMYSRPSIDADVVSQAIYGSNVGIVEEQPGWAKIRTADAYTGWMPWGDLRRGEPYAVSGAVGQVESMFAHIYREPDVTKRRPLLTVPFETRLEVPDAPADKERWFQVRLADGGSGWLQSGDVVFNPPVLSIPQTIELSKRFLGLPYTWGGTSSYGYDCSGFMQMLCRRRGKVIPRDAGPQARWSGMAPVEFAELEPGDLLYFGRSVEKISHTGMYLGDGKFINATTFQHPTVRIDDLSDPHWKQILVAARRLK